MIVLTQLWLHNSTVQSLTIGPASGSGYRLDASIWVPTPKSLVFPFFAKAENLEALTPESLSFRIETPLPIHMESGHSRAFRGSVIKAAACRKVAR